MIEMSGEILLLMSHWLRAGLKRIDAARFAVIIGMLVIKILMFVRLMVGKLCVEVLACCKKDEDGEVCELRVGRHVTFSEYAEFSDGSSEYSCLER